MREREFWSPELMQLHKVLSVAVIAVSTVAGAAGTAVASAPSDYSASVACDATTSQAKITVIDTDPNANEQMVTVLLLSNLAANLPHVPFKPTDGAGDSMSVEVPWTPGVTWTVQITDGPLQMASLSVHAPNTGCGTVAEPVSTKPRPKPTHSKTASPKPSTPAAVPSASPKTSLAETGSSGTGLELGVAVTAVAVGAGALILGRRRSAARHD